MRVTISVVFDKCDEDPILQIRLWEARLMNGMRIKDVVFTSDFYDNKSRIEFVGERE